MSTEKQWQGAPISKLLAYLLPWPLEESCHRDSEKLMGHSALSHLKGWSLDLLGHGLIVVSDRKIWTVYNAYYGMFRARA